MLGPVVILGLGYTTQRLALRLRQQSIEVHALVRDPARFAKLAAAGVSLSSLAPDAIPQNAVLVHTIPPLEGPENSVIHQQLSNISPRRVLYISSTGVYGSQTEVDHRTPPAPNDAKGRARLAEEEWIARSCAETLILRSAAIYGPWRGIHVRLREGKIPRGAGGVVSRIHVDDLVSILEAGIESQVCGAWPVADDCPAASEEVAAWCANFMHLKLPGSSAPDFPVAGRRVNGLKIREILGVGLKYPTFKAGIPASLDEEQQDSRQ